MSLNIQGLGHKAKKGWIEELCLSNKVNFMALQKTKMKQMDLFTIKTLWGNLSFDYAFNSSVVNLGSIPHVWETSMFAKDSATSSD